VPNYYECNEIDVEHVEDASTAVRSFNLGPVPTRPSQEARAIAKPILAEFGAASLGGRARKAAMMEFIKRKITKDQCRDTGMAMVLLLLLLAVSPKRHGFLIGAIVLHVVNMIVPQLYRPVAVVWLGLSNLLGEIVPKVLLSIVFFLVVTPIGLLRRLAGKDALKLRAFKASKDSVMLERNHTFTGGDLTKPY
jgi:hypothetical protein